MISTLPKPAENPIPEYFVLPQSKFLDLLNKNLTYNPDEKYNQEIVYRRNSSQIDRIHFYNKESGAKIKTNYYDYFNDKKIKSVDEYDEKTGQKIRTTNYTLYKSVTEYNRKSGKKLKTVNYSLRDENKITSIYEYHSIYDRVTRISIFRQDGKSISMVKEINPLTERVEQCINYKKDSNIISSVSKYEFKDNKMVKTTCYYTDHTQTIRDFNNPPISDFEKEKNAKLIDNLFKKNLNFTTLQL